MLGWESRIYAVRLLEPAEPPKGGTPNGGSVKLRPGGAGAGRSGGGSAAFTPQKRGVQEGHLNDPTLQLLADVSAA